jgi:hypothetical protein
MGVGNHEREATIMKVRAKFRCNAVTKNEDQSETVKLFAGLRRYFVDFTPAD